MIERPLELLGVVDELVLQHDRAMGARQVGGPVGRKAVDHELLDCKTGSRRERTQDVAFFVVGQYDDGNGHGLLRALVSAKHLHGDARRISGPRPSASMSVVL